MRKTSDFYENYKLNHSLWCVDLPGQFSREPEVTVYDIHEGVDPLKKEATMEVKGNRLPVTRYVATHKKGF